MARETQCEKPVQSEHEGSCLRRKRQMAAAHFQNNLPFVMISEHILWTLEHEH